MNLNHVIDTLDRLCDSMPKLGAEESIFLREVQAEILKIADVLDLYSGRSFQAANLRRLAGKREP